MNVNTLLEGSNPYKQFSTESAKLATKWKKSGLLEGADLVNQTEQTNMAVLLENQAKQLVQEANQTGTGALGLRLSSKNLCIACSIGTCTSLPNFL